MELFMNNSHSFGQECSYVDTEQAGHMRKVLTVFTSYLS